MKPTARQVFWLRLLSMPTLILGVVAFDLCLLAVASPGRLFWLCQFGFCYCWVATHLAFWGWLERKLGEALDRSYREWEERFDRSCEL